jgi:hypothetical protein
MTPLPQASESTEIFPPSPGLHKEAGSFHSLTAEVAALAERSASADQVSQGSICRRYGSKAPRLEFCRPSRQTLHNPHRYNIHGRLYRFVQVMGYERSYLSYERVIVNIAFFHSKDDRDAPSIRPPHFHDRPYGDSIGLQKIDEDRITTRHIITISGYRPLWSAQQMLRIRVLEDAFVCEMRFSAERRKGNDVRRKPALDVPPPIQSIFVGYSGQRSC